jgi:predicted dehydrogenase
MTRSNRTDKLNRREFLAGAAGAAAATAFTVVRPSSVRGSEANSTIELGLLGCGGRGNWITALFNKHGKYRFVACADYYQDRVDKTGDALQIDAARRYTTLSAYKRLLDDKIDAVVIETPPYFHPREAAAAVEAGRHVYLTKPVAVDVPGCKTIAEAGRKATAKKLAFLVDFQTPRTRSIARRRGASTPANAAGSSAAMPAIPAASRTRSSQDAEDRLRDWYNYRAFSGDFIVEQSIHALDYATVITYSPLSAAVAGGSKGQRLYGDDRDTSI